MPITICSSLLLPRLLAVCLGLLVWAGGGLALAGEPLLWMAEGRPKAEAMVALDILAEAETHGLAPADYGFLPLREAFGLASRAAFDAPQAAQLDAQLTTAMTRYLNDLHFGRVSPRQVGARFDAPSVDSFDALTHLQVALAAGRLPAAVDQAAPANPQYQQLRQALAEYRTLVGHPAWDRDLPTWPGRKLEPGMAYRGLAQLRERLVALGDLPAAQPAPAVYQGPIVEGVRAFQARHGLEADGVIGKETLANLNVTPAQRVRQIVVNLERLRWTPALGAPRMIAINVPEFMLRAYEVAAERPQVKASMKVIIGKAMKTETSIFTEDMRFIEFSPYWNVPPSIARAETLPKLQRDAGYWHQEGFEFVAGDGRVVTELTPEHLQAVRRGELRIRQRPGARNALGDIKFVFPNADHIYLHHTPAVSLFKRARRDFSHGCIRVEDPVALALFVLQNDPEWNETRIRESMSRGVSSTLRLRQPVRVLIAYNTVVVQDDGRVHFYADLYGHDARLEAALRRSVPDN